MWKWLEKPETPQTWAFALRVIVKATALFVVLNILFALIFPIETLGVFSLYNWLVPGRERLPYGENPAQSYNISLNNIPAMFESHKISGGKPDDEFRVILIGDSSTWGWLLENDQTLSAQINAANLTTEDGQQIRAYNLGYPIMSLTKDLMLLDISRRFEPDLIVWLITLESFPRDKQVFPPLVQNNPERVRDLIARYNLNLSPDDPDFIELDFMDKTIWGQRRSLADLLRLQVYGFSWAATGIDQYIPAEFPLRASDFEEDISWQSFTEPQPLTEEELAFDVLAAGFQRAGDVPVLLVNEPMFISDGINSDLRYNFFYSRWAYDAYRELLTETAQSNDWTLIDLWDAIPPDEFTDTPVHLTPAGTRQLAELLLPEIIAAAQR